MLPLIASSIGPRCSVRPSNWTTAPVSARTQQRRTRHSLTPASLGHSWKAPCCLFSRAVLNEAASSAGVSLVAVPCGVYESIFASLHSVIAAVVDRVDSVVAGIAGWGRAEGEEDVCFGRWMIVCARWPAKVQRRCASRPRTRYHDAGLISTRREGGVYCRGAKLQVRSLWAVGGVPRGAQSITGRRLSCKLSVIFGILHL